MNLLRVLRLALQLAEELAKLTPGTTDDEIVAKLKAILDLFGVEIVVK